MSLASICIRRPVTTFMLYAGVVMLGILSLRALSVDFLPQVPIPRLSVQTHCPNTPPREVEYHVTQPIESALGTVTGVKRVLSVSREGMSLVRMEFYWGVNMDFALLEVREKLDQVFGALPKEAGRSTILRVDPAMEPVMRIAVSFVPVPAGGSRGNGAGGGDLLQLRETARALVKRRIEQVEGVAQASVLGGVEREIQIDVRMPVLESCGLSIDNISEALASSNINLPGGTIRQGTMRYSLRTLSALTCVNDIRDVVVRRLNSGRPMRISDIAEVRDTCKERRGLTRYNGAEVVVLEVRKDAGTNTVEVSHRVRSVLEQLRTEYSGLELSVISDQSEFITRSVTDVEQAMVVGSLLASLVLFYFLRRPRYPLIIGLTMPVSILATIVSMYILHINLNVISLTGLALGIGMLGDNAIVLIENVTRLRELGKSLAEATLEGAREIGTAVTASTLTNVAIFLPVVFVEGVAAQLFKDMALTMTVSLMVSLLVAVTLVPMLVSRDAAFQTHTAPAIGTLRARIDRLNSRACVVVDGYLVWALSHPIIVLGSTVLLFVLALGASLMIPAEQAPEIDRTCFIVGVRMPKGTSLDGISGAVRILEREIQTVAGVIGVFSSIGVTEESVLRDAGGASIESAMLEVRIDPGGNTREAAERVRLMLASLSSRVAGVEYSVKPRATTFEQILSPESNDVKIRITGNDPETLAQIAGEFTRRACGIGGLVDLRTSLQEGSPEYTIVIDREAASRNRVDVPAVATHIIRYVRGQEATFLNDMDTRIAIRVQPDAEHRNTIDKIINSELPAGGRMIPVRDLVNVHRTGAVGEIWRENRHREQVVTANVKGRPFGAVAEDLEKARSALRIPPGYAIQIGGGNEEITELFNGLLVIIALSVSLVFMILAAEYESLLYPLVILLTSPLAFIGAIGGMLLCGDRHNVMSLIGIVIMIGAVDNDAVIAVDLITALRREGHDLHTAIRRGMQQRLRPIVMTTATTVLGVIPLVFDFGEGSGLVRALTAPLVGGLIASTFFTLATIPVVYAAVDRWGEGRRRGGRG